MQSSKELTCGFKCYMKNLVNFHPTTQKSENFTPMGYSCPKYMRFELKRKKKREELSLMALNNDAKFEKPLHCRFKNGMKNWVNFLH